MVETMRTKLKKEISDDASQDAVKKFISAKTASVNDRLSELFKHEKEKVTTHVLRKIYFREAFLEHGIKTGMTELAYACEVMGHGPESFQASATYTTVFFY
jgi:hypothetical protein